MTNVQSAAPKLDVSPAAISDAARRATDGRAGRAARRSVHDGDLRAGGDLAAKRKLFPAIYELAHQKLLADDFALLDSCGTR